jgi:hypothetical protein
MAIELQRVTCKRCGHSFIPRCANPLRCRKCGCYKPIAEEPSEQSEDEIRLLKAG